MRLLLVAIFSLLAVGLISNEADAQYAPFCVVSSYGTDCGYQARDECERSAQQQNGACVVNQTQAAPSGGGASGDVWGNFERGVAAGERMGAPAEDRRPRDPPDSSQRSRRSPAVVMGGGVEITCQTWLATPQNRQLGDQWILGYWSGQIFRNVENRSVGATRDKQSILAVIHWGCVTTPDELLINVVNETYARFDEEGR